MAHVPKRAVQHQCYLSSSEVPPTTLKPGQTHLRERNLYTEEAPPLKDSYIRDGMASDSVYVKDISLLTQPVHYMEPTRPIKQVQPNIEGGHHDVSHWRSEYKSVHSDAAVSGAAYHRQTGPCYQASNPISCLSRPDDQTSYLEDYGKPNTDPRDRVRLDSNKMPVFKTELTRGTTKAT